MYVCCCVQPDIRPLATLIQLGHVKDTRLPGITSAVVYNNYRREGLAGGTQVCCQTCPGYKCMIPRLRYWSTLTQQIKDTRPKGITSTDCLRVTQNRRNSVRALLSSVNDLVSAVFLDAIYYMYCGSFYHQVLVSNISVVAAMLLKNTLPHSEMVYVCLLLCTA